LQGYIIGGDSRGDIRTHVKATDPDWARATQGYIYVYTDTDFVMPGFEGYNGTTIDAGSLYSSTYADGSGNVYNVWRYGVTATTPGEVYIRTTGNDIIGSGTGRVNAMQFQAVPEPNSAMLLGIGGLIGAVMLRRKYAVEA
jgi:hypothetical protein